MAPDLRYMLMTGISNSETVSIINSIFKKKSEQSGTADLEQSDPKNDDDLSEVVWEYLGRQKSAFMKPHEEERNQDKNRKDKNYLSDEKVERLAVWIQQSNRQARNEEAQAKEAEAQKRFRSYNHHHYFDRWGTVGPKVNKDEEWWIANPPVLSEDDPEFLCDMCRHINFNALLTERDLPGNDLPGPTKIRLHGVDKILKRKHCSFCRLVAEKITTDGVIDLTDEEKLKFVDLRLNVIDDGNSHGLRLEIELEDPLKQWTTQRFIIQKMECEDDLTFRAVPVDQTRVSPRLISMWSQVCEETHSKGYLLGSDLAQLRLIDVNENRVCEVPMPCRFVALSYVWGGVEQVQNVAELRSMLQENGGLTHKSIKLPKTITDAMEVARWLNIRYLWVDSLCIEQDNEDDKREIISKMGSIYSGAALTIVAASNKNPYDGLPGVTDISRTQGQIRGRVQGTDLAVAFHDARLPIREIEESRWNSRGWTYQERQLSPRMVFFTSSQAIFTCSMGTNFEDTVVAGAHDHKTTPIDDYTGAFADPQDMWVVIWNDPTLLEYTNKAFQTDDGIVTMVGEEIEDTEFGFSNIQAPIFEHKAVNKATVNSLLQTRTENIWTIYKEAATSFSLRSFTDPRDILPAFQGLGDVMCRGYNMRFWYNLPDFALTKALLWYAKAPMRRRAYGNQILHPSWSWAGWEGSIKYRDGGWFNSLYCGPIPAVQWLRVIESGTSVPNLNRQAEVSVESLRLTEVPVEKKPKTWTKVDPLDLYHIKTYATQLEQESAWTSSVRGLNNKHEFCNPKHYNDTVFDYLIPLPDQVPITLPDQDGTLSFVGYSVRVRFCDMPNTKHNPEFCADPFLQIGLNDEKKSANSRPSWQRIIYHQGYRAGFLTLDVPFESLDLGLNSAEHSQSPRRYRLVALSRDELPQIPNRPYNPSNPEDLLSIQKIYNSHNLVRLHYQISREQYCNLDAPGFFGRFGRPPNHNATPQKAPENETGDAKWDVDRFGPPVGKVSYHIQTRRVREPEQPTDASEQAKNQEEEKDTKTETARAADDEEYEIRTIEEDVVYPLYNVLLVEEHGYPADERGLTHIDPDSYVTRVGVGKMHFQPFHHANPSRSLIQLR